MVKVGQVWEFCGTYTVLTLRPRPDLDERYVNGLEGVYWDVLVLRNDIGRMAAVEGEGVEDWCGIEHSDEDWERLS